MEMLNADGLRRIQNERVTLGLRKNNDYSGVIDNVEATGLVGIGVRLFDKACRIFSLVAAVDQSLVKEESIRDTLLDAGNYSDYGVAMLDGRLMKSLEKPKHFNRALPPKTTMMDFDYVRKIQEERLQLALAKHAEYSSQINIVAVTGMLGIVVRLFTKASRIVSLTNPNNVQHDLMEPLRDSFLDAGNYSDFGVAILDGNLFTEQK